MITRIVLLLACLISALSCQTTAPKGFIWDYNYAGNDPMYQDSLQFKLYYKQNLDDTLYVLLDSTEALEINIVVHRWLYSNKDRWFHVIVESMKDGKRGLPSTTIRVYFPEIIGQDPINFKMVEFKY